MARPRRPGEPRSYRGKPSVPAEQQRRFEVTCAVLGGRLSTSEAARALEMARPNMQTLVHRAQQAVLEAITPRPSGPTPQSEHERELEIELTRVRARNATLERQVQAMDEMLGAAGEIIRSLRGLPPTTSKRSSPRSRRSPAATPPSDDGDPEPPAATLTTTTAKLLTRVAMAPELAPYAARALGVDRATFRRWLHRHRRGLAIQQRRGGCRAALLPEAVEQIRGLVRELGDLAGAASLARSVTGVSRRAAAEIKHDELTAIERERKQATARVEIVRPGVVRGFDAMHLDNGYALIAVDAAVPYRTSAVRVTTYDAGHVARALDDDFARHGPPLILRFDRAACHDAEPVASVLARYGVLPLHGPPRCPRYYGQLEHKNREHRSWERHHGGDLDSADLDRMTTALNALWRRPTLDWRTAAEAWAARTPLLDDRDELHHDVHQRAARLRACGVAADLAMRLAIEQALTDRGYLRITPGHRVLCG